VGTLKKKGKRRTRSKFRTKILFLFLGFFAGFVMLFVFNAPFREALFKKVLGYDTPENTCILVVGQDSIKPLRSDTIILVFLNTERNRIMLYSVPRDSRFYIPDRERYDKINHAYAFGGIKLLKKTLEEGLGISIPYFVEVDYEGFEKVIDLLGGVEIEVEERMKYQDKAQNFFIDLKPGRQVLDGEKALQYVRFRADKLGDIGRIKRQQKFLQALLGKMEQLDNIVKAPEILESLRSALVTNLQTEELIRIALWYKGLEEKDIRFVVMPGEPTYIEGVSYWKPDFEEARKIILDFFDEEVSNP
jgi:LCP family protein required for cell wall assembly